MSSVRKEVQIEAPVAHVWAALADFAAVDRRVAPGFVTACKMDGDARIVTFANGTTAREILIDSDNGHHRLVYAIVENPRLKHHNASVEVFDEGNGKSRVVWRADFLPAELKPYIDDQMGQGAAVMKRALAEG